MRQILSWVLALTAVLVLWPASPSYAHHAVTRSSPAAGETMDALPRALRVEFAFEVKADGVEITLIDDEGTDWPTEAPIVTGNEVFVVVEEDGEDEDGRYVVRWSVISLDGAALQGEILFSVGAAAADPNFFNAVIDAGAASMIRTATFAGFGALITYAVVAVLTTYTRRGNTARVFDEKEE